MTLRLADDRQMPPEPDRRWATTVHHGGRAFVATATMAGIFEAKALDVIARGETELVPLLHRGGVDLLLITPTTKFAVVSIELGLTEPRTTKTRPTNNGAPKRPLRPASHSLRQ